MVDAALLEKYNVPVPRYTSYPTVPYWEDNVSVPLWTEAFLKQFETVNDSSGISLYIHLPFCESLCTYCGCNKKITTNHGVEEAYITSVINEWQLYRQMMKAKPVIREIHLGGGTPTFFSPDRLVQLLDAIFEGAVLHPDFEFGFEGHPNNTTAKHLQALYESGFRRVSFGVQDNNPYVQKVINRIQPFENVKLVTEKARSVGYHSVNFDLIYGLPFQSVDSISRTIKQVLTLMPDRVAFYSYAHVPWTSKGQRLFDENDLPSPVEKLRLYQKGRDLFLAAGYTDIGMDHFAVAEDELHKAWREGELHRNFMGYTTKRTGMMIGLGVSGISDLGTAYAQNHKTLRDYYRSVNGGELAIHKGIFLNEEDLLFKQYILDISCRGETHLRPDFLDTLDLYTIPQLEKYVTDELVSKDGVKVVLTEKGRGFIRNVCSAFDIYLQKTALKAETPQFSKAI
jgi:oxygen-independent coproporphyrinogen-3 oxidase